MNNGRTGLKFGFLRLAARDLCPAENHGEIIRAPGFGRLRKFSNDDFRFANVGIGGRMAVGGGYRQLTAVGKQLGVESGGVESGGKFPISMIMDQTGWLEAGGWGVESTVDTWEAYLYFLFVNTVRMPRIYSSGIFIAVVRTGMFAEHKMGPEGLRVK
jgi:hypothetical protein